MSGPISILTPTLLTPLIGNEMSQHLPPPLTDSPCSRRSLQLCHFCAPWFRSPGRLQLDLGVFHHGSSCTVGPLKNRSRRIAAYAFHQFRKQASALGPAWSPLTSKEWRTIDRFPPWEEQNLKSRPRRNYRRISAEPQISRDSG